MKFSFFKHWIDLDISSSLRNTDFSQCPLIFWKNKCFNFLHNIENYSKSENSIRFIGRTSFWNLKYILGYIFKKRNLKYILGYIFYPQTYICAFSGTHLKAYYFPLDLKHLEGRTHILSRSAFSTVPNTVFHSYQECNWWCPVNTWINADRMP